MTWKPRGTPSKCRQQVPPITPRQSKVHSFGMLIWDSGAHMHRHAWTVCCHHEPGGARCKPGGETEGWAQADEAAVRGGAADGVARVGADRGQRQVCGHCCAAAAAGAYTGAQHDMIL